MTTQLPDYHQYLHLTTESFHSVTPSNLTTLNPSFLRHSSDLSIVICIECRVVISGKKALKGHISQPPHHLFWLAQTKTTRDSIISSLVSLPWVSYQTLPPIPPNVFFFDALPLRFDTYKCPDCDHFSLDSKVARNHRVKTHGIRWETRTKRSDILYGLPAQILFPQSNRGLFIPRLPSQNSYIPELPTLLPMHQRLSTITSGASILSSPLSSQATVVPDPDFEVYLEQEESASMRMSNNTNLTSKNTSTFLKNSRFNLFHRDKNVESLQPLVSRIDNSRNPELTVLHAVTVRLQHKFSSLIPNLIRPVRLELKEEEHNQLTSFTKDFIELEVSTKKTYFESFARVFVFLVRLLEKIDEGEPDENFSYLEKVRLRLGLLLPDLQELQRILPTLTSDIFEDFNEEPLEHVEATLVNIVMQLLKTEIHFETTLEHTTFYNPMMLFFILLAINPDDPSTFKSESIISKQASIIIYCSRLFFIGSMSTRERQTTKNPDLKFSIPDYYKSNLRYLTASGSYNYFAEITRIRRYILKILKDRVSDNRTIINVKPDTYLVYGSQYSFDGLCTLFSNILNELREILFNRLILLPRRDLPRLNLRSMDDDATISTKGYYLMRNPSFLPIRDFMHHQLKTQTSSIYRSLIKSVGSDGIKRWERKKVADFLKARLYFIKLLLLASHLMSGSPLRGTEWEWTALRNFPGTDSLAVRDVIWMRHQNWIQITTHWTKTQNITRKSRSNLRFLPPTLSYILVYYIAFTIPVYNYIRFQYLGETELSPFLFEDNGTRINSPTLSRLLYIKSSEIFRNGLTLNPYRHLINHILLEKTGPEAIEFIDRAGETSDYEVEKEDSIIDIQANRSTKTSQLNYSLLASRPGGETRSVYLRTIEFTRIYQTLFKLDKLHLDFEDLDPALEMNERSLDYNDSTCSRARTDEQVVQQLDIPYQLTRFFRDKTARFRDVYQKEAVFAIFESLTYLTYVNKTGSGKSLLYLLPAYTQHRDLLNIVLTPRISLKEDLLKRGQDRKIRVASFDAMRHEVSESHTYQAFNLIIASIESIDDSAFSEYIVQLARTTRPIRIYIDEVHTIILEKNFRWIMKYANNLLKYKVPLVFISATLPVPLLQLVEKEFLLPQGVNRIIRANTVRENIEYEIVNIEKGSLKSETKAILKGLESQGLNSQSKAIIFVSSVDAGNHIAKSLKCAFYHARAPEKEKTLHSFLTNQDILTIVATSALSLGVDFNVVKFTIHIPPFPGGVIEFIQSSSRIRQSGHSIIVQEKRSNTRKIQARTEYQALDLSKIKSVDEFKKADRTVFQKLLNEDQCIRQILSHFLDNIDLGPCLSYNIMSLEKVTPCYICRHEQETLNQQALKEETMVRKDNMALAILEEKIDTYSKTNCLFCLLLGNIDLFYSHSVLNCPDRENKQFLPDGNNRGESLEKRVTALNSRLASGTGLPHAACCYTCLLPPRVCSQLKEVENRDRDESCVHSLLLKTMIVIFEITLEKYSDLLMKKVLGLERCDQLRRPGDPTGLLDFCRSSTELFNTDAIMICQVLYDLNLEKIVDARENIEDRAQLKRYRVSI